MPFSIGVVLKSYIEEGFSSQLCITAVSVSKMVSARTSVSWGASNYSFKLILLSLLGGFRVTLLYEMDIHLDKIRKYVMCSWACLSSYSELADLP
jgi:hypothetical protein